MADNVPITPGSGRDIATDDVGSVHYQKIKIALGADGAVDTLLDAGQQLSADSVPVVLASDHPDIKITLDGEQVVISGTVQVQSNSANLATEATAAAIQTAVELIDNAISGSEMQVDLVGGGPIGTTTDAEAAADGTVIAILKRLRTLIGDIFSTVGNIYTSLGVLTMGDNSAYTATMDRVFAVGGYMDDASPNTLSEGNIGTLRVTTNRAVHVNLRDASGNELTPGGTQYTEDAGAAANPTGTALIMVRDDSRVGSITNADGDNIAVRGNNKGEQYVKDTDAAALLTTIDTDTGAIASTIDALAGALASVATDALTANIITGETGVAGGTGNAGANTIRVVSAADDPAVATLDNIYLSLGAGAGTDLAAIVATTGNQVVSLGIMDDWDESDRAKVSLIQNEAGITGGQGPVESNTPRVTLASNDEHLTTVNESLSDISTNTYNTATSVSELLNALSSYANDALLVGGDIAHDSGDGNNPVKIGHVAKNFDGSAPGTPVAEEDRVNSIADVYGRQYVEITHPAHWTASADYASAQTNASIKAAPGAGLKLYITDVIISNGATAGNVTLLDGSGGTVKLEIYPGVNGGLAHPFRTPIALTANTALCITSTTVTTHSVTICGYTAP